MLDLQNKDPTSDPPFLTRQLKKRRPRAGLNCQPLDECQCARTGGPAPSPRITVERANQLRHGDGR
ncbi:hypothetical protein PGT21_005414 [Puccinia graminis f. sp. tritici]|uniref:Uncharacterized protein n=1 Tax=Puccinia graminis f. sp. tritici TaxID=56615 RepID=A0A5B0NMA1_PUCGR|nr:hypothetical protein PGT21_005414 [Puccinia graminis f. sp. tritici]